MRILTVLTYYHPHWTGLTQIARELAERLARRGHEVTVLTSRHDPALPRTEDVNGVRVVRLWAPLRVNRGVLAPGFGLALTRQLRAADVVQMHTPLPEALLVSALAATRRRPVVMTHQGDLVMPADAAGRVLERVGNATMGVAARLATAVTTHNRDYADHSRFLGPVRGKLTSIYPPVAVPTPRLGAASDWRRELGLEDRATVGFAGRWVEEKGFDVLLRSLPRLLEARPDVQLVYAGQAHMSYERFYERCRPLLARLSERVTFVGLIGDRQRLADFYALCDVLAVPSRTDCFPTVQVEAMECGTPVVVSDIPGARVPVRETGMGLAVRPEDPAALADGIVAVLAERDRFAARAGVARDVFDPERSADEYERLLLRVATAA